MKQEVDREIGGDNRRTKTKTTNLTVKDVVILDMQTQKDMTSLIM